MNRNFRSVVPVIGLSLTLCVWVSAAPGDLDPSFGKGGVVVTPITYSPFYDWPNSMQVQSDGSIVVCGEILEDDGYGNALVVSYFIARYLPSGTLDDTFGTNGKVLPTPPFAGAHVGTDIVLQPDGKIVAVGFNWTSSEASYDFAVNRYNENGTLDPSFGNGGHVVTPIGNTPGGNAEFASSVTLQPDGKIIVAGYGFLGSGEYAFAVVRYDSNGSLDPSFGTGGKVATPIGNNYVHVGAVLLQPDGKIVVVGGSGTTNVFTLVRYNADGSLDSTFGTNGKVFHSMFSPATFHDGVLQADGKIVAAGTINYVTTLVRYNTNGSIDTSFGENGLFIRDYSFGWGRRSIAMQPDGKLVAFDQAPAGTATGFAATRLTANGVLDTTFGGDGTVVTPIGSYSSPVAGGMQTDGKILAFGRTVTYDPFDDNIAIVRYLGDPAALRTKFDFDGDRRADISVFRPSDRVWYLDRSAEGFSATQFGLSTDEIAPEDFDGDGKTDIAVFRDGVWYRINSADSSFAADHFGIAGDVPVPADHTGDGRAELAIYRNGSWWTLDLSNGQASTIQFGLSADKPVVADYDGDGRSDEAIYRDGEWHLNRSSQGYTVVPFGLPADSPVVGDYDGDGSSDLAVYRNGTWYLSQSTDGFRAFQFGLSTDIPAPADYDGDGKTDAAVYRDGTWYLLQSTSGFTAHQFGLAGDKPIPSAFLP